MILRIAGAIVCSVVLLWALPSGVAADKDLAVLQREEGRFEPRRMLSAYLQREAQKLFEQRRRTVESLKTPADIQARQEKLRKAFLEAIGGPPARTPLNPRILGSLARDGFKIERVIYESRPGHHVTGLVYVPKGRPPFPGILMPLGHYNEGKAAPEVQQLCALLAKNGFVVLVYDPIGQGERSQLIDSDGQRVLKQSTTEHSTLGVGALLVGRSTASYRIWDGMRSLDYLASRRDVDAKRLGCTGVSGGGTLTSYLMALDDRIACAAPSCYITSLERLFATIGPQDAEQNIPGQVAFGLEHADYVTMRAPRPTLINAATQDFFDTQGTWTSFREAKRIYSLLGFSERVDISETNSKHGYPQPMREATVRWMRRWLMGIDRPVVEGASAIVEQQELRCTKSGQVLKDLGGRSAFDFTAERERELSLARAQLAGGRSREDLLKEVRRRLALRTPAKPSRKEVGVIARNGYDVRKVVYETEPGVLVPALSFEPKAKRNGAAPVMLYLDGRGSQAAAGAGGAIEALVRAGHRVVAADLRGFGETAPSADEKASTATFGADFEEAFMSLHIGRPLLGQRVYDLLSIAMDLGQPLHVVAVGAAAPVALHAAALDTRIAQLTLEGGLASWSSVARGTVNRNQLTNVVVGALESYDLPDLEGAIAPRSLTIRSRTGPDGAPASQERASRP